MALAAAGDATNVVTDYAWLKGEARSPNEAFTAAITAGIAKAFEAARTVTPGKPKFTLRCAGEGK